jgi:hypothetical protein
LFLLGASSGCNQILGLKDDLVLRKADAYTVTCQCTNTSGVPAPITVRTAVCLPKELNPNQSAVTLTQQDLDNDATNRVQPNVNGLVDICVSHVLPCTCTAAPLASLFPAVECDSPCTEEVLDGACNNWNTRSNPPVKTATNVAGQPPVCIVSTVDPPNPVPEPLSAGIFALPAVVM